VPKPYPLENVMSPAVRSLLASDFGHRYTARERFLHGHKVHRRNRRVWREISERSFEAETVDLRPFPDIADLFFSVLHEAWGHAYVYITGDGGYPGLWIDGLSGLLSLKVSPIPFSREEMKVEIES